MTRATNHDLRVNIRDMSLADIPAIMQIERLIFPDPWSVAAFKEQVTAEGWGGIVAECGGAIIGYGCYYIVESEAHLTNLGVVPKYRRKSVAKQLLGNILQFVTERNCEYVFLEVRPSNRGAVAFYEKHHFEVLYRRPNYYKQPVEDALVMGRYLGGTEKDQQL
ncbi:MAG: ribosomal protein S18-alanine N-acetyltransferase [Candidatus Zixiibacteriota bacterium]|nr:MAG: ribosomal protein S18-alanine N-acetyltransferase [candidate division Zixibacteria bacterium]